MAADRRVNAAPRRLDPALQQRQIRLCTRSGRRTVPAECASPCRSWPQRSSRRCPCPACGRCPAASPRRSLPTAGNGEEPRLRGCLIPWPGPGWTTIPACLSTTSRSLSSKIMLRGMFSGRSEDSTGEGGAATSISASASSGIPALPARNPSTVTSPSAIQRLIALRLSSSNRSVSQRSRRWPAAAGGTVNWCTSWLSLSTRSLGYASDDPAAPISIDSSSACLEA